jgi:hypothetical protein
MIAFSGWRAYRGLLSLGVQLCHSHASHVPGRAFLPSSHYNYDSKLFERQGWQGIASQPHKTTCIHISPPEFQSLCACMVVPAGDLLWPGNRKPAWTKPLPSSPAGELSMAATPITLGPLSGRPVLLQAGFCRPMCSLRERLTPESNQGPTLP